MGKPTPENFTPRLIGLDWNIKVVNGMEMLKRFYDVKLINVVEGGHIDYIVTQTYHIEGRRVNKRRVKHRFAFFDATSDTLFPILKRAITYDYPVNLLIETRQRLEGKRTITQDFLLSVEVSC